MPGGATSSSSAVSKYGCEYARSSTFCGPTTTRPQNSWPLVYQRPLLGLYAPAFQLRAPRMLGQIVWFLPIGGLLRSTSAPVLRSTVLTQLTFSANCHTSLPVGRRLWVVAGQISFKTLGVEGIR